MIATTQLETVNVTAEKHHGLGNQQPNLVRDTPVVNGAYFGSDSLAISKRFSRKSLGTILFLSQGGAQVEYQFGLPALYDKQWQQLGKKFIDGKCVKPPFVSFLPVRFVGRTGAMVNRSSEILLKPVHQNGRGVHDTHDRHVATGFSMENDRKASFSVNDSGEVCQLKLLCHAGKSTTISCFRGSTTRAQARTAKRPEAPDPSQEGEDIVCSALKDAAAREGGFRVATGSEHQDKNSLGVSAGMIWGLKKTMFNSLDFGALTISTYAVAH